MWLDKSGGWLIPGGIWEMRKNRFSLKNRKPIIFLRVTKSTLSMYLVKADMNRKLPTTFRPEVLHMVHNPFWLKPLHYHAVLLLGYSVLECAANTFFLTLSIKSAFFIFQMISLLWKIQGKLYFISVLVCLNVSEGIEHSPPHLMSSTVTTPAAECSSCEVFCQAIVLSFDSYFSPPWLFCFIFFICRVCLKRINACLGIICTLEAHFMWQKWQLYKPR